MNIQRWFPLGLTGFFSLLYKGVSRVLQHHNSEASLLQCSASFMVQLSHLYMTTGKNIALTIWTFVGKKLSRFVLAFLPRSKHLLVSWLQLPSSVILEPKNLNSVTLYIFPPSICHEMMAPDAMILVFWMLNLKPAFLLPLSPSSRGSLVSLNFSPLG